LGNWKRKEAKKEGRKLKREREREREIEREKRRENLSLRHHLYGSPPAQTRCRMGRRQ
jgi:hypothetical protein